MMDSSRFKEILLPLHATLYRAAFRIVRDSDVAKDMVQDVYTSLWSKRDSLGELENIESFALRVVKNRCIDYLRTSHVYEMVDSDTMDVPSETADTDTAVSDTQRLNRVMTKMDSLPERQRQVLMMRSVQDMSLEEIEKLTGLTNLNVRTLLSRARKRLRELCEAELNI